MNRLSEPIMAGLDRISAAAPNFCARLKRAIILDVVLIGSLFIPGLPGVLLGLSMLVLKLFQVALTYREYSVERRKHEALKRRAA